MLVPVEITDCIGYRYCLSRCHPPAGRSQYEMVAEEPFIFTKTSSKMVDWYLQVGHSRGMQVLSIVQKYLFDQYRLRKSITIADELSHDGQAATCVWSHRHVTLAFYGLISELGCMMAPAAHMLAFPLLFTPLPITVDSSGTARTRCSFGTIMLLDDHDTYSEQTSFLISLQEAESCKLFSERQIGCSLVGAIY